MASYLERKVCFYNAALVFRLHRRHHRRRLPDGDLPEPRFDPGTQLQLLGQRRRRRLRPRGPMSAGARTGARRRRRRLTDGTTGETGQGFLKR